MMRKDIKHIKGIGFDDVTDDIVKDIMASEKYLTRTLLGCLSDLLMI